MRAMLRNCGILVAQLPSGEVEEDRFEVGAAEGEIFEVEARGGGGVEEAGEIGGVVDGELGGGVLEGAAMGGGPDGECWGRVTEAGDHLCGGGETVLDEGLVGVEGDDAPVVDDGDAVGEALGLFHVVGGVNDGHAAVAQGLNHLEDAIAGLWIDADGGLVHEDKARLMNEAGGHVEAALHSAG